MHNKNRLSTWRTSARGCNSSIYVVPVPGTWFWVDTFMSYEYLWQKCTWYLPGTRFTVRTVRIPVPHHWWMWHHFFTDPTINRTSSSIGFSTSLQINDSKWRLHSESHHISTVGARQLVTVQIHSFIHSFNPSSFSYIRNDVFHRWTTAPCTSW